MKEESRSRSDKGEGRPNVAGLERRSARLSLNLSKSIIFSVCQLGWVARVLEDETCHSTH